MRHIKIVVVLLMCVPNFAHGQERLSDVLRAQQSTAGLIYSLSATFVIRREVFNGRREDKLLREFRWAFDDGNMRERQVGRFPSAPQTNDDGFAINRYDIFVDRESAKGLLNWDWDKSPPLRPAYQGPVRAHFGRREQLLRGQAVYPRCMILFEVQADNVDVPRNVSDFLSENPQCVVSGPIHSSGLIKVVAKHPGFDTQGHEGITEEYYFNPKYGSLLSKLRIVMPKGDILETEVVEFRSFGNGVFLPVEITSAYQSAGGAISLRDRRKLSDIQVNDDVDEREFEFRFPNNCLVTNVEIPKDGPQDRYELFLWGPDNKPVAQLESATELPNYNSLAMPSPNYRIPFILTVSAGVFGALLLIYGFRKYTGGTRVS